MLLSCCLNNNIKASVGRVDRIVDLEAIRSPNGRPDVSMIKFYTKIQVQTFVFILSSLCHICRHSSILKFALYIM